MHGAPLIVPYKLETRQPDLQPANLAVAFRLTLSQEERELVRDSSDVYRLVHSYTKYYHAVRRQRNNPKVMVKHRKTAAQLITLLEYLPGYCPAV